VRVHERDELLAQFERAGREVGIHVGLAHVSVARWGIKSALVRRAERGR
jgi:hypothetical protein